MKTEGNNSRGKTCQQHAVDNTKLFFWISKKKTHIVVDTLSTVEHKRKESQEKVSANTNLLNQQTTPTNKNATQKNTGDVLMWPVYSNKLHKVMDGGPTT